LVLIYLFKIISFKDYFFTESINESNTKKYFGPARLFGGRSLSDQAIAARFFL